MRQGATAATEGTPAKGLRSWREIVTPHPDVAAGRYNQAEFVADLAQVMRREGSDEYGDPVQFFARTYPTEGLRLLLVGAMQRIGGAGASPSSSFKRTSVA